MSGAVAIVGAADSNAGAILVTATAGGVLIDRRRVELLEGDLPRFPYHHEAQALPLDQATALIARVRACAERLARPALDALARDVRARVGIGGIALRRCPPLPETVAGRLASYRARNVADWVVYRQVLAAAAQARGWPVAWYDPKTVFAAAARVLRRRTIDDWLAEVGRAVGPPWRQDHRLAMAAAIAAGGAATGDASPS
jgi:hypothetical protein